MCLSALGWAAFAVLRVSSLDSWETALLSSRDEPNTWQMFEEAKQHWRRKPDISLVEAVIWRGNRVTLHSRGQGQLQMDFKGCVRVSARAQTCQHVPRTICMCVCACLSVCVREWFEIWVRKYEQRVEAQRSMMWSKACTYIIQTWAHVAATTVYYCNPSPGCKMQKLCNQLDNQFLSPTGSHAFQTRN